jgi:hypothetical protein
MTPKGLTFSAVEKCEGFYEFFKMRAHCIGHEYHEHIEDAT